MSCHTLNNVRENLLCMIVTYSVGSLTFKSLIRFPDCQTIFVWFGLMWCASLCLNPQSNCKFLGRSLSHCTKQYEYWCKFSENRLWRSEEGRFAPFRLFRGIWYCERDKLGEVVENFINKRKIFAQCSKLSEKVTTKWIKNDVVLH